MKIRTQFIITMLLFGIILAVLAVSAIITHQKLEKANEQEKIASSIAQGASELSYLSNDYLIYRESQQLSRWQSRFASLSNQVASLNVDRLEQQVLVRNIQANEQRLKQVFDSVVSAVGGPPENRSTALDLAFLQVSWSRMAVQSQGLVSDASRLSQLLHQQMDQLRNTTTMLIYFMVGLFGVFLLVSYMLTYRRILKSIVRLQAGAAVIGSGNLDFVIRERTNDEIGDLSHAFNQMTANLKDVTASKSELEREIAERKKAEEELRQQREWLRVTLSSIGDAVIASDTEGRITFLNPVAVTLTGWQLEETLGQPITHVFQIINEKTHQPAEDLVARVLNEKRVVALANDTALVTKDDREVSIEDSAAPILDSAGNVIGVILVFHDVTEKRRAQAALRESENTLRIVADFTYDWEYWRSPDKRFLYLSPSCERVTGYTREEFLHDPALYTRIIHPHDRERFQRHMEDLHNLEASEFEFRIVRNDGQERWIGHACQPVLDAHGKILGRRASNRDITARKQGEAALREAHERAVWLARFPDENPNPVLRVSADGTMLYCNPASAEMPGWECEVGKPLHRPLLPLFRQSMTARREVEQEVDLGGRHYSVSVTSFPEEGYANIYGRDITERKQAEEALRRSEERLSRAQEIAHLGSWELDLINNRLTWSDEVYRIFGLRPQEFSATYEAFLEAVYPDDRAAVDAAYSASVREGREGYEIEHRVVRKSTCEVRTVHERCEHIRDASGRIIRSVGMVHDITERKRAEEAIVQAKEEWERTFDTVPDLVSILDNEHRIVRVNKAMADRLALTPEQCIGLKCHEAVHGLSGPAAFCPHALTCQDSQQHVAELHEPRLGGDFLISTTPLCNAHGQLIGSVHVARDITERKRAEEALRQRTLELQHLTETLEQQVQERTAELEAANEVLRNQIDERARIESALKKSESDLRHLSTELLNAQEKERKKVAGEIHDSIGSSLSAIKFKVESTMTEAAGSPKTTTALKTLIPIVQGAIEEARRIQMNLRPSMLDDLGILATISWFCRQFESTYSRIRVSHSIEIEEREVPGSLRTVIFRVLQEGLNNIAKHSMAKMVLLSLRKTDQAIELVVQDNGKGFDLSKAEFSDRAAHGLGLNSMRERTELSRGSFEIESTLGKGTTIRASWPV